jgi:hypothetical protein
MNQLAIVLMNKVKKWEKEHNNDVKYSFTLPIKKVCGLKVDVTLQFFKDKEWLIKIISDDYLYDYECNYDEDDIELDWVELYSKVIKLDKNFDSIEYFEEVLIKVKDLLTNIKFNKLTGRFVLNEDNDYGLCWKNFLDDIPTVECAYENCVVCYEPTFCSTKCKHSVCYMCINQLKPTYNSEWEKNEKFCPICREVIN